VYHAVTDALLGAIGAEDIGQLFPDDDPRWKGADSTVFVEEAVRRITEAGFTIGNIDVTIVCQRPKLSPHKRAMRENLVRLLGCRGDGVNLKGKTHEEVDAIGEGRAIGCHVVALLQRR
jgi:2-C-methyl-D-erythritol 2,4-cyclodiphosphate synthase